MPSARETIQDIDSDIGQELSKAAAVDVAGARAALTRIAVQRQGVIHSRLLNKGESYAIGPSANGRQTKWGTEGFRILSTK
jgi:hypothetical protein